METKPYTLIVDKNTMFMGDDDLVGPKPMVWAWHDGDGMAMDWGVVFLRLGFGTLRSVLGATELRPYLLPWGRG